MNTPLALILLLLAPIFVPGLVPARQEKPAPKPEKSSPNTLGTLPIGEQAVLRLEKPSYPLTTCAIGGEPLGAEALDKVVSGHLVRVCGAACAAKLEKAPERGLKAVAAGVIREQKPRYPLTTCPVTGEKLGEGALDHVYGTRLVRLQDQAALRRFEASPGAFLAKLDKAWIDAQLSGYRLKTCPVTGEKLGSDAVNHLYGTRLVRLCCSGCIRKFDAAPEKFLASLDAAH